MVAFRLVHGLISPPRGRIAGGFVVAALLLAGCGGGAKYVDSQGPNTIVSLNEVNIQDWSRAADEMVASLMSSSVLDKAPQSPAIMAVSRIVNNTSEQVDTDMLTKKIRVALNKSGKVLTSTTAGGGDQVEDPLAKDAMGKQNVAAGRSKSDAPIPDYTLSGKILEDRTKAGSVRQTTYIFQLSLTDTRNGLAVWEEERQITKQGKRATVGW